MLLHLGERDALIWLDENAAEEILCLRVDNARAKLRELVSEVADLVLGHLVLTIDLLAVLESFNLRRGVKGRLPIEQLKDDDSERPNVDSPIVPDLVEGPLLWATSWQQHLDWVELEGTNSGV